jgi:hypothetical protein
VIFVLKVVKPLQIWSSLYPNFRELRTETV